LQESLELPRGPDDKLLVTCALFGLGSVARDQGDYTRAAAALEESVALARELGSRLFVTQSLAILGGVTADRGDVGAAYRFNAPEPESLRLAQEMGAKRQLAIA